MRLQSMSLEECRVPPLLLLLPGSLSSGVVVHVRVPSMDPIELLNHLLKIIIIIIYLKPYSRVPNIFINLEYLTKRITYVNSNSENYLTIYIYIYS